MATTASGAACRVAAVPRACSKAASHLDPNPLPLGEFKDTPKTKYVGKPCGLLQFCKKQIPGHS